MWTIYGLDAPEELGGKEHLIGELITTSEARKSLYGDEMLFFRHQLASDDFALRPKWEPYYKKFGAANGAQENGFEEVECPDLYIETISFDGEITHQPYKSACPFAFLQ